MPESKIAWEPDARQRLSNVPFFIRPFVRSRAERAARDRGLVSVTCALLDELKRAEHKPRA